MTDKIVQTSTWSNVLIKKSTFWPYPVRVLVLIAVKWIFQTLWPFDPQSNHIIFILTHFGFEPHDFALFFGFFSIFWSLFWLMNQGRTKYGINSDRSYIAIVARNWSGTYVFTLKKQVETNIHVQVEA